VISVISLVGVLAFLIKDNILKKLLFYIVAFSAGTLMGGALLHLIPEAFESNLGELSLLIVILGFMLFFVLERLVFWHHCHHHHGDCPVHTFTYMSLVGDSLHNFIDGLLIAASFAVDVRLGLVSAVAIIMHEIPQEISDFGILIYGGFSKGKALLFNFASALTAILGAIVGYFLINGSSNFIPVLLALTSGGFLYISASDLVPELHKESQLGKSVLAFLFFIVGVALMYLFKVLFE
jgi:zinc and cadmium transporter